MDASKSYYLNFYFLKTVNLFINGIDEVSEFNNDIDWDWEKMKKDEEKNNQFNVN